jgi:hypothetical protein
VNAFRDEGIGFRCVTGVRAFLLADDGVLKLPLTTVSAENSEFVGHLVAYGY